MDSEWHVTSEKPSQLQNKPRNAWHLQLYFCGVVVVLCFFCFASVPGNSVSQNVRTLHARHDLELGRTRGHSMRQRCRAQNLKMIQEKAEVSVYDASFAQSAGGRWDQKSIGINKSAAQGQ